MKNNDELSFKGAAEENDPYDNLNAKKKSVKITIANLQNSIPTGKGQSLFSKEIERDDLYDETLDDKSLSQGLASSGNFSGDFIEDYEDAIIRVMEEAEESYSMREVGGRFEIKTTGIFEETDEKILITYDESALSGMEGTVTSIQFDKYDPSVVIILRSGSVKSVFILEEGKRHITVYDTPLAPFEACIFTKKVENNISISDCKGEIYLDYLVEIRGADAQRTKLKIIIE